MWGRKQAHEKALSIIRVREMQTRAGMRRPLAARRARGKPEGPGANPAAAGRNRRCWDGGVRTPGKNAATPEQRRRAFTQERARGCGGGVLGDRWEHPEGCSEGERGSRRPPSVYTAGQRSGGRHTSSGSTQPAEEAPRPDAAREGQPPHGVDAAPPGLKDRKGDPSRQGRRRAAACLQSQGRREFGGDGTAPYLVE